MQQDFSKAFALHSTISGATQGTFTLITTNVPPFFLTVIWFCFLLQTRLSYTQCCRCGMIRILSGMHQRGLKNNNLDVSTVDQHSAIWYQYSYTFPPISAHSQLSCHPSKNILYKNINSLPSSSRTMPMDPSDLGLTIYHSLVVVQEVAADDVAAAREAAAGGRVAPGQVPVVARRFEPPGAAAGGRRRALQLLQVLRLRRGAPLLGAPVHRRHPPHQLLLQVRPHLLDLHLPRATTLQTVTTWLFKPC